MLLDEALAAVAGGEVEDFIVVEEIFCQLFSACERAQDVERAEQWIRVGEAIAERRRLPAVSAYCRTHYGGILTAAGRWPEADDALTEAVRLWALGRRTLKAGALVRLADLRVKQGRLEEAERLLDGMGNDPEATLPLASLQFARGETRRRTRDARTCPAEGRSGQQQRRTVARTPHDIQLAGGDLAASETSVGALAACAKRHPSRVRRGSARACPRPPGARHRAGDPARRCATRSRASPTRGCRWRRRCAGSTWPGRSGRSRPRWPSRRPGRRCSSSSGSPPPARWMPPSRCSAGSARG